MHLKLYTIVTKELKLIVKVLTVNPTFVEVTG